MATVALALRRDPLEMLAVLAGEPGTFLLEVPDAIHPVTLLGCAPVAELRVEADGRAWRTDGGPVPADPFTAIERFVAETPVAVELPFPLAGGLIGYVGYEAGRVAARRPTEPLAVLRRYDPIAVHDHLRGQWHLVSIDPAYARAPWLERLAAPAPAWEGPLASARLAACLPAARYRAAVECILDYLAAGDAYQVNLTQPFTAPLAAPAWALYARLARRHPVPHGAYLDLGDTQIVCNSPELFLRRRGRRIETRPIKGTRPRGE